MGSSKRHHDSFLAAHPICCFCGGKSRATTMDHFPPRTLFRERKWPEGFVFPACKACNDASRKAELLVAMIARSFPDAEDPRHKTELHNLMASVHRNFPGLLEGMRISRAREKREFRERGVPATFSSEIGMFSIQDARFDDAVSAFATKLLLALMYRHTGTVLPPSGGMPFRWFTNSQNLDEMLPRDILAPLLKEFSELKRENTSLDDQFFYRFSVADTKRAAVFLIFFSQSLVVLGFVFPEIDAVKLPDNTVVLRPLSPGSDGS